MRVVGLCLLLAFLNSCTLFSVPKGSEQVEEPPSVVDKAIEATIGLRRADHDWLHCAGVITKGVILTAYHCVDEPDAAYFAIWTEDETEGFEVEILYPMPLQDLAILRAKKFEMPVGRKLSPEEPKWGDKVIVVGHPMGLTWSMSDGIISHPLRQGGPNGEGHVWTQISVGISQGHSGGPVFNVYGEVIGIITFTGLGEHHLSGSVPWYIIRDALDQVYKKRR